MLLATILEFVAVRLALSLAAIDNALLHFFGIGALCSARIRIRPAIRMAGIGLAKFIPS